jgi:Ni/Fe-hydrogenase subunit HybB-like protein
MIKKLRFPRITPLHVWILFLVLIISAGLAAGIVVFAKGLIVTNLTDLVPWGLWITIDLSSIALSAGAFLLSAAVYLLGLKRFEPVARTAVFIGLIGYSMALCTLLLDIGRPDRFWHALVYWNPHSVLWEVTMCVTLYLSVLILEFLPILGRAEWFASRWTKLYNLLVKIHKIAPVLAIIGLGLSMLHQSSLGATYGVVLAKPIWYRPGLSVLFIISAMAGGISMTVSASMLASKLTNKARVNDELLEKLSLFVGWVLVGYLYFRFWDYFSMTYTYEPGRTEGLQFLSSGPLAFNFWIIEIICGAAIPIIILLNSKLRARQDLRLMALLMVVAGLIAYRWDINLAGLLTVLTYLPQDMTTQFAWYVPSYIEVLAGAGVVGYGLLAFTLGVRYLDIVNHFKKPEHSPVPDPITISGEKKTSAAVITG